MAEKGINTIHVDYHIGTMDEENLKGIFFLDIQGSPVAYIDLNRFGPGVTIYFGTLEVMESVINELSKIRDQWRTFKGVTDGKLNNPGSGEGAPAERRDSAVTTKEGPTQGL